VRPRVEANSIGAGAGDGWGSEGVESLSSSDSVRLVFFPSFLPSLPFCRKTCQERDERARQMYFVICHSVVGILASIPFIETHTLRDASGMEYVCRQHIGAIRKVYPC